MIDAQPRFLEHIQSRDRKGIEQTQLSNDSGKHFLQIVYSQNFVFEEKKKKKRTTLLSLDIFSPPSSSPLWYFYIQGASVFGVKEFWGVLLDLYCLVECSYNHSPLWAPLSFPPPIFFYWRPGSSGHPVLCKSNSRNSFSVPIIAEEAASSMFLFLVWVFVFVSCTRWTFSIQCSSNKRYDSMKQLSLLKCVCLKCAVILSCQRK